MRRNIAKTAPLGLVIILSVMLIAGIVALMNSIPHSIRTIYKYLEMHTGVGPRSNPLLVPVLKKELLEETPVELDRLMTCRATEAEVNSIVGKWPFAVLALNPDDMNYYVKRMRMTSLEGRMPGVDQPDGASRLSALFQCRSYPANSSGFSVHQAPVNPPFSTCFAG